MKIYSEKSLRDFEFWRGACDNANKLSLEQLDEVETALDDIYPNGMDETAVNDLFWFDFDWICSLLGYEDEEDFCKHANWDEDCEE